MSKSNLPDYQKPPLREVAFGVTFDFLQDFSIPHVGMLWSKFENDFQRCIEQPPLPLIVEEREGTRNEGIHLGAAPFHIPRIWLMAEDERQLIQIQKDRFLYNWKKVEEEDQYLRFPRLYENFMKYYREFEEFLESKNLKHPVVKQYELSYFNHMPIGKEWKGLSDLGDIFSDISWESRTDRFLPEPTRFSFGFVFPLPEDTGRLHVSGKRAIRNSDSVEIIELHLTARGFTNGSTVNSINAWFGQAHEWIVRGFAEITSSKVQELHWERRV